MKRSFLTKGKKILATALLAALISLLPASNAQAVTAWGAISQGVDVSKYNGVVDWGQVKASGMDFTFIKVGSTKSGIDPMFVHNITQANAAGLKTGVYLYSYATTPQQAQEEANQVLQWIDGYTVNYPVVFDIEDKCHKKLSDQQLIDIINAFCMTIDAAGYYPMVYSSKNMFAGKLSITGWDKWVAQYNDTCEYNNNVCFWQYTSQGRVPGFPGRVDLNYQYKDYSQLIIQEGFIAHGESTRFYRNWRMQKGWINYNDTRYYLDGAGNLVRGWFADESGTYYLTPADGSIARGQYNIDGQDYYFTAEGVKTLGWVVLNEQRYYYDPAADGIMKRGWFSDEKGNYYYFDSADGHMLTGAVTLDGANYMFGADGIRVTGMVAREDGSYYYDPATGAMVTGWIGLEDKTCYADEAGHIVVGTYEIDGQKYHFDVNGALVRNQEVVLDGITYSASPEGILTEIVPEVPVEGAIEEAVPAA